MLRVRGYRISLAPNRRRTQRLKVSCGGKTAPRVLPRVKVAFQLPYRTRFGQKLSLVGSGVLGEWNLQRAVPMTWSAGDVWTADLSTDLLPGDVLHYKYVVCNPDGGIEAWKPGANIVLEIPTEIEAAENPELRVLDTWDGAVHEVGLETETKTGSQEDGKSSSIDIGCNNFMSNALKNSYEDLEVKLNAAQSLLDATRDAGAMELVLADRELALAANKASALARVVKAATQAAELDNCKWRKP